MKVLGLDLGVQSVGWALVTSREGIDKPEILTGAYVFPEAGELDKGLFESHRHKRGIKRRMRRNLRRKRERRDNLQRILIQNQMLPAERDARIDLFCSHYFPDGRLSHPYALRKRGLDEELSLHELGRCLFHINRRRGYLSTALLKLKLLEGAVDLPKDVAEELDPERANSEGEEFEDKKEDKERSDLLRRMADVRKALQNREARTLGEYYADRLKNRMPVRGAGGKRLKDNPERDPLGMRAERQLFEHEFETLWNNQSKFHPKALTETLKAEIYRAIFDQRDLRSSAHLVGTCEFFPNRKRAARATLVAQRTIALQYLNTLQVRETPESEWRRLSAVEIMSIAYHLDRMDFLYWDDAKSFAGLTSASQFSDEPMPTGKRAKRGKGSGRSRERLQGNKTGTAMRKAIGSKWHDLSPEQQDDLLTRLLTYREVKNIVKGLRKDFGFSDKEIYQLAIADLPDGHANHCSKVLHAIEPYLLEGKVYSEACEAVGFREPNTSTEKRKQAPLGLLAPIPDLRNPIVQRSVESAREVINAIIIHYGMPDKIRIEMPRDVSRTNKQREDVWRAQDRNAKDIDRAKKLLTENGLIANDTNAKKVRLWEEAGCRCPYFPSENVTLHQLISDYEIDHIVPRSRSYDDSWGNLTICPFAANQEKSNRTPHEAWGRTLRWSEIESHVKRLKSMSPPKKDRILRSEWEEGSFINRALTDTRYISKVITTAVKTLGDNVKVEVTMGQLTALLRNAWELGGCLPITEDQQLKFKAWREKAVKKDAKPRFDHRHHALDAIVTALTDISTLQELTRFFKEKERGISYHDISKPKPWPTISKDLRTLLESCVVVHKPTRGIGGPLHKESALKPPPQSLVDAAIARLPEDQRKRIDRCVVVGLQLVWLDENSKATKAYDLRSNHHAAIWESMEPDSKGKYRRDIDVITMIEASRRASQSEPIINQFKPGWRFIMALCENDIVEWTGDDPGPKRVTTRSASPDGSFEIVLRPVVEAQSSKETQIRVRSRDSLDKLRRRICFNAVGIEIASEPEVSDD